ncbi:MAG: hypothetical protein Q9218_006862 [Villophora microphyllina]
MAAMQNLAYNTKGWGYNHNLQWKMSFTTLAIRDFSTKSIQRSSSYSTPSLALSTQEQTGSGPPALCALWVGMLLPGFDPTTMPGCRAPKLRTCVADGNDGTIIPTQKNALRVVVLVDGGAINNYGALVNSHKGLCEGLRVNGSDVYFFPEFRDDSVADIGKRLEVASLKINQWKNINSKAKPAPAQPAPEPKNQVDDPKFVVNDIEALLSTFEVTQTTWPLVELNRLLEERLPELRDNPVATCHGLRTVFSVHRKCGDDDVKRAVEDFHAVFKDLASLRIDVTEMKAVALGLRQTEILLEYKLIRPFFVFIINRIRDDRFRGQDIAISVKEVVDLLRSGAGSTGAFRPLKTQEEEQYRKLFRTIQRRLGTIVDCFDAQSSKTRPVQMLHEYIIRLKKIADELDKVEEVPGEPAMEMAVD